MKVIAALVATIAAASGASIIPNAGLGLAGIHGAGIHGLGVVAPAAYAAAPVAYAAAPAPVAYAAAPRQYAVPPPHDIQGQNLVQTVVEPVVQYGFKVEY